MAWSYPFALAQFFAERSEKVLGFAGPPGVGKSSLVSILAEALAEIDSGMVLQVSLDDFYLPREERERRGFTWRAPPGTHDLDAASRVLTAVHRGDSWVCVPRFDHARDERRGVDRIEGPVSRLLCEGWFLGLAEQGYEALRERLDYLTYLDCPLSLARERRLGREAALRGQRQGGGMSQAEVERFWDEVLEPGTRRWVLPLRKTADLVIHLDEQGEVTPLRAPQG